MRKTKNMIEIEKAMSGVEVMDEDSTALEDTRTAYEKIRDFSVEIESDECKILGQTWNETPRPNLAFKDWPERFQEVITIKFLVKRK